ncbi:hypothetical protein CEP51_009172 [Fusarium floridanum]|uniref:Uncharacterized protein n=1 Tax=Fusarium floridanum TaxID=1325733 RepID=A0A428RIG7_9HYPO|nr:hypothetical protein CEP51_009172 [Fusarium floridanum]
MTTTTTATLTTTNTKPAFQLGQVISHGSVRKHRSTVRLALLLGLAHDVTEGVKAARKVHEEAMLSFGIFPFENKEAVTRRFFDPKCPQGLGSQEEFDVKFISFHGLHTTYQEVPILSLALCSGNRHVARILLREGSRPSESLQISSLHAAARRGYREEMEYFVKDFKVDPDILDKDGATPVVYALLQPEMAAWETICFLFYLGAIKNLVVGDGLHTYAELANSLGKHWLADKLEEVCGDASSCTMDFDW